MGKLRKNHVKRIYKKTYDKSPSVAKIFEDCALQLLSSMHCAMDMWKKIMYQD